MTPATLAASARARRIATRLDLAARLDPAAGFLLERAGDGVVARGAAHRIEVPAGPGLLARAADGAAEALAPFARHAQGPGALVVGALPFDEADPGALAVPAHALVARVGEAWELRVGEAPAAPAGRVPRAPGRIAGAPVAGRPRPSAREFRDAVARALALIRAGRLEKVVLARALEVEGARPLDVAAIVRALRAADPTAFVFACDGLVGASPELLVGRSGRTMWTEALAATAPRAADPGADREAARALLASDKERREHAAVVAAVCEALGPACDVLEAAPEPHPVATSRLWHLATPVRGILRDPAPSALALAALLHPTPSVCGTPREAALAAIRELEPVPRGRYAGMVGWQDARGDGEWAVALRCAEVRGTRARLFAGAGVVAGSEPDAELAETEAKLAVFLAALEAAGA